MAKEYSQSELQEIMFGLLSIGNKLLQCELDFIDNELMLHEGNFSRQQEDKLLKIYDMYSNQILQSF